MKIAYGKLGRSIPIRLDDVSNVGGDIEVVRLLHLLAQEGHEIHLVGRNRADVEIPNVVNHWLPGGVFEGCPKASRSAGPEFDLYDSFLRTGIEKISREHGPFDATIFWLGQHGSSVHPVPAVQADKKGTFTNPLLSDVNYGHPITLWANLVQAPIWVCPDPRNMIKFRDLWSRDQRLVMAQFNTSKNNTFYDERDGKIREGSTKYAYAGIELLAIGGCDTSWHEPPDHLFGILVNEGYSNLGTKGRLHLLRQWTRNLGFDYEIFGTWSEKSQAELGRTIEPVPFDQVPATMRRWKSTITFPATASGWATAKPWEAFAAGCVCFAHPDYDSQNHIYSRAHMLADLRDFLRPATSTGLVDRIKKLEDDTVWRDVVQAQRDYLRQSLDRLEGGMWGIKKALRGEW